MKLGFGADGASFVVSNKIRFFFLAKSIDTMEVVGLWMQTKISMRRIII